MVGLIKRLRADKEIQELKKRCHELTGEWPPYDWENYLSIDEYKEDMRRIIREHEQDSRK